MSARPSPLLPGTSSGGLSRVPYLPGLDGMRAIAVIGVVLYHAHHDWVPGGYLGVEVFFVISGYLITLLLLGEHERTGTVNLGQFWKRRFRRLLPALFVMMALVAVYIGAFFADAREETRGDFLGGIFYVSNWYQIFVGQGYGSSEAFVPLRHLWSLAVEEQFYLLWPLVMIVILRRSGRRLPAMGIKLIGLSAAISIVVAILFVGGPVATTCSADFNDGCWSIGDRFINVNDMLYLGSFSRAGGLMLGAGFAMLWRPVAVMRGPLRDKGRRLDVLAVLGLALVLFLMATMQLSEKSGSVFNPWLFRGGFFLTGVATLMMVAAATHQGAVAGRLLGNPVLRWVGTRSYGLYLYHWPIYQIIRKQANIQLTVAEVVVAMCIALPITELSYRFIETPIRQGGLREMLAGLRRDGRQMMASVSVVALLGVAVLSMVVADPHCVGDVRCSLAADDTSPDSVPESTTVTTGSAGETIATTTTVPKEPQAFVAIGESVMVGATSQLQGAGVYVDAKENRGPEGVKNTVIKLRDAHDIGEGTTIVIQVGTNAPMNESAIAAIMEEVPDDAAGVVFLTLHADVAWVPANNELIRGLADAYPNVSVIDWDAMSAQVQLCPDGIHLTCNGTVAADFYANLILAELGLPAIA